MKKVLKAKRDRESRVINVNKNPAYPPAIEELKQEGLLFQDCDLRRARLLNSFQELVSPVQKKYLNADINFMSGEVPRHIAARSLAS